MLKRPSSRRKSNSETIELNLIPILDALVTLVAFLLFSSAFLAIVAIDSPAPLLAPASDQIEKLKEQPLQLTATIQADQIILSDWSGSRENHVIPSVPSPKTGDLRFDIEKFHLILTEIKKRHPSEKQIIFKPEGGVAYEAIVELIDTSRSFEKTDAPLFEKNESGVEVQTKKLFPEIVFGNILS